MKIAVARTATLRRSALGWSQLTFGLLFLTGGLTFLTGCGNVDQGQTGDPGSPESAPTVIEYRGRVFQRADTFTSAERAQILAAGRATPEGVEVGVEQLAAQMRSQIRHQGVHYIEAEPNYELAAKILSGEEVMPSKGQPPREGRWVQGSDGRTHVGNSQNYPFTTFGFLESGCSGTKIGTQTLGTAAHCVFDTQTTDQWMCETGVGNNSCPSWPQWRFGVEDGNGFGAWLASGCDTVTVPTAFMDLASPVTASQWWTFTRWDYAVVDLSACAGNPGTGWLGTIPYDDTQINAATGNNYGYPARATCPTNSNGAIGFNNGGVPGGTTCPGTGGWPGSSYRYNADTTWPFSGAEQWGMSSSDVTPGTEQAAETLRTTIDNTQGQSGSSMYVILPGTDRRVIGFFSVGAGGFNQYKRWTVEVHNFFDTYSQFPDDTI
jgi:V8-like Glu-specific endopeptidase